MIHSQDIAPSLPVERPLTWAITFGESNAMDKPLAGRALGRKPRLPRSGPVALTRQRLPRNAAKDCITWSRGGKRHIRPLQATGSEGPRVPDALYRGETSGVSRTLEPLPGIAGSAEAAGLAARPDVCKRLS